MALAYTTTLRNARLDAITTAVDGGAGAGLIRIYDGTRPASGGAATTLLATLTCTDPSFGAASSGTLTAATITQDSAADATGTATWFQVVTSAGTFIIDGSVAASGSDLNLTTTSIITGQPVSISSFVITEGNP